MSDLRLLVQEDPLPSDVKQLAAGLHRHAAPQTPGAGFRPIAVFARRADGELVGGIGGEVNWNWLFVSLFWVAEDRRATGLGSRLIARIESEAAARGCEWVHLDTFSFQARSFYEHRGYEVFATLADYPPGHSRHFLKKRLAPDSPSAG